MASLKHVCCDMPFHYMYVMRVLLNVPILIATAQIFFIDSCTFDPQISKVHTTPREVVWCLSFQIFPAGWFSFVFMLLKGVVFVKCLPHLHYWIGNTYITF